MAAVVMGLVNIHPLTLINIWWKNHHIKFPVNMQIEMHIKMQICYCLTYVRKYL